MIWILGFKKLKQIPKVDEKTRVPFGLFSSSLCYPWLKKQTFADSTPRLKFSTLTLGKRQQRR
jgi:hypothetical protein